jgi:hypothetical protein
MILRILLVFISSVLKFLFQINENLVKSPQNDIILIICFCSNIIIRDGEEINGCQRLAVEDGGEASVKVLC